MHEIEAGLAEAGAPALRPRGRRGGRRRASPRRLLPAPAAARAARRPARARGRHGGGAGGSLGSVSSATDLNHTAVAQFSDRVAEAVERKRTQLVVGLDPRVDLLPMEFRGEAVLGRALRPPPSSGSARGSSTRSRRTSRPSSRRSRSSRRSAATAGRRSSRSPATPPRQDCSSSPTRSAVTSARPRGPTPPPSSSLAAPSGRWLTLSPSTPISAPTRWTRSSPPAATTAPASSASCAPPTPAGGTSRRRPCPTGHRSGAMSPGSWTNGVRTSSASGDVERRCGRRRHGAAADGGCAAGDAAGDHPPAGCRRPGRVAGGRRACLYERPGERARQRSRSVIYAYRETEVDWREAAAAEAARLADEIWAAAGW